MTHRLSATHAATVVHTVAKNATMTMARAVGVWAAPVVAMTKVVEAQKVAAG